MLCRKCKKENPDGAVFCAWCGTKQVVEKAKRTRPNGAGFAVKRGRTWTARLTSGWRIDPETNKKKRITRSKGGFATKREALEYIQVLRRSDNTTKFSRITFISLYDKMIERHEKRVGKSTIDCYKAAHNYFSPLYPICFADILTDDLQECVEDCPKGKRTKENMKALASLMYKYAQELKVVTENFAQFIWIPRSEQGTYNAFSEKHEAILFKAANSGDSGALLIICDCYLGFRPTAFLSIETADYDAIEQTVTGGIKTEAGKNRTLPIPQKIKPFIEQLAAKECKYLFSQQDKPMSAREFRENIFYPTLDKLGIQVVPSTGEKPFYQPYSCRHTFATKMKNIVGSDKDKAAIMGHTSYEMTLKYQHEDLESKRGIMSQL